VAAGGCGGASFCASRSHEVARCNSGAHGMINARTETRLDALADSLPCCHAPGCGEVKAIEVHHFGPGSNEVLDELRVRVRASVHF
jgi:hypothetical protein